MDKELKATILALCNELEDALDANPLIIEDEEETLQNLAFVRYGLEYL